MVLKGSEFLPFDWKLDINNQNDTFCNWGDLGKTPAMVLSTTEAECLSPANTMKLDTLDVNLTLNNQNYTVSSAKFFFFNPPQVIDAEPLLGSVIGGTEVNLWGNQF